MGTNFMTAKIAFDEPSSKIKSFSQSNNISKKTNNNIII